MTEYLFAVDNYSKPKKCTGVQAEYYALLKLILMNPGENPLFPAMGVGLVKKYRYAREDDLVDIETDIYDQISQYLPSLLIDQVSADFNNGVLRISISSTERETSYTFSQDQLGLETNSIESEE